MVVAGLVHGLDYLTTLLLVGVVTFSFWAGPLISAGVTGVAEFTADRYIRRLAGASLATSLAWLLISAADMTESWSPSDLWEAISQTTFGHLWCVRLGVLIILLGASFRLRASVLARWPFCLGAWVLPLFSSLNGHAVAGNSPALAVALDWVHSVAAGSWAGGLFLLTRWLSYSLSTSAGASNDLSLRVVKRFSHLAMASTAAILFTGIAMAVLYGVSLLHPVATPYGSLIVAKALLFGVTLGLASINQFIHMRGWVPEGADTFARSIRREATLELVLVVLVFGIAGFLTRTSPPGM